MESSKRSCVIPACPQNYGPFAAPHGATCPRPSCQSTASLCERSRKKCQGSWFNTATNRCCRLPSQWVTAEETIFEYHPGFKQQAPACRPRVPLAVALPSCVQLHARLPAPQLYVQEIATHWGLVPKLLSVLMQSLR